MNKIYKYLKYRIHSRSKYDMHSPFLYEVWAKILRDKTNYQEFSSIEHFRNHLLKEYAYVKMLDLGARASDVMWNRKIMHIRKVVKKSAVSANYGKLLFRLSRHFQPQNILELGTSMGISTAYLSLGNPEATVTTIEGCPETAEFAKQNFRMLGLYNIKQLIGSFDKMLPVYLTEMGKVDLAFIDGNHRKNPTVKYFDNILQHITDKSVIVIDDIHWSDEMEEAWKIIKQNPSVKLSIDLFQMGIVFFREGLSKEDFVIGY